MPQIKVTISPSGETKIETIGFTGDACKKATSSIEAALSGSKTPEAVVVYKPDYYGTTTTNSVSIIQGY